MAQVRTLAQAYETDEQAAWEIWMDKIIRGFPLSNLFLNDTKGADSPWAKRKGGNPA